MKRQNLGLASLAFGVLVLIVAMGWNQTSPAQGLSRQGKGNKGAFEALLTKHGSKGMLLEIHIRVAGPKIDKVEILGKVVKSTDAFLVVQAQNQRDLSFIPWEHVLWITARPN